MKREASWRSSSGGILFQGTLATNPPSRRQRLFMTLCVSFHQSRANETAIACLGRNSTRSLLMLLSIIKTSGSCLASLQVAQMVSYARGTVFTNLWWAAVIDYWTCHGGVQFPNITENGWKCIKTQLFFHSKIYFVIYVELECCTLGRLNWDI